MSDEQKRGKKRKKSYYIKSARKQGKKDRQLDAGMKGFLITCNNAEKQVVREAYNLLNEYAEKLYGPEQFVESQDTEPSGGEDSDNEDEDIEAALAKEVKALKQTKPSERRFQMVNSGAHNCVFIKTAVEDPCELAHAIFTDIAKTQQAKSRFIQRLMPISGTCKTYHDRIKKLAEELLEPHFKGYAGSSYCVNFRVRNNNNMERMEVISIIGDVVENLDCTSTVEYNRPDYMINVEIIRTVCCMSVVKDFHKLRKYNLQEIAKGVVEISASQKGKEKASSQAAVANSETPLASEQVSGDTSADGNTQETAKTDVTIVDRTVPEQIQSQSTSNGESTATGKIAAGDEKECLGVNTRTAMANEQVAVSEERDTDKEVCVSPTHGKEDSKDAQDMPGSSIVSPGDSS